MRLLHCSKTVSKRNRRKEYSPYRLQSRLLFSLFLFAIFLPAAACPADDLDIVCSVSAGKENLLVSLEAQELPAMVLKDSLNDGHGARLRYQVRLSRPRRGIMSFLGEAIIDEWNIEQYATWNPVAGQYRLGVDGETAYYQDFSSFFPAFAGARLSIPWETVRRAESMDADGKSGPQREEGAYLQARLFLIPKVPVPPFTLLTAFIPQLRLSSPWIRVEIPRQGPLLHNGDER